MKVVIVGASAAGLTTAETLRADGFTGKITLVGAEDTLPYDRPPLSKAVLLGQREPEALLLRPAERFADLDLDLRLSTTAVDLDVERQQVTLQGGELVDYDRLVIHLPERVVRQAGRDLRLRQHRSGAEPALPRLRIIDVGAVAQWHGVARIAL